jgi:hypothetical protein
VTAVFLLPTNPGQVYSINTDAVYPFKPPRYGQFGDGGNKSKSKTQKVFFYLFFSYQKISNPFSLINSLLFRVKPKTKQKIRTAEPFLILPHKTSYQKKYIQIKQQTFS